MSIVLLKCVKCKTNILKHSKLDGQPRQKRNQKEKDSYFILHWAFPHYLQFTALKVLILNEIL